MEAMRARSPGERSFEYGFCADGFIKIGWLGDFKVLRHFCTMMQQPSGPKIKHAGRTKKIG
jgi:hypothetical protein